eukprot:1930337-Rhodomonas_salina.1
METAAVFLDDKHREATRTAWRGSDGTRTRAQLVSSHGARLSVREEGSREVARTLIRGCWPVRLGAASWARVPPSSA